MGRERIGEYMIKGIKKIFIDLDGVTFDTIECITALYNEDFKHYKDFKPINSCDVETWDFTELNCADKHDIERYFNQPRFFDYVEIMPRAETVIRGLALRYDIIFVSMGNKPNLKQKKKWVKEHFPYAKFKGVNLEKYSDKSHIDMHKAVLIDDSANNLRTSNAKHKICFGDIYSWNKDWAGTRCANWTDVEVFFDK